MSMVIKSKQILTATLIVALGAAVMVNWYYTNTNNISGSEETTIESVSGNLGDSLYVAGTTQAAQSTTETTVEGVSTLSQETSSSEYFSESKLKRNETYDEVIDEIEDILENTNLDSTQQEKISVLLSDYQNDMKVQTDAENLIKAKTGSECLVVINDNSCQVILEKNTLNDTVILQITEIIEKNTNISAENLTIIELK